MLRNSPGGKAGEGLRRPTQHPAPVPTSRCSPRSLQPRSRPPLGAVAGSRPHLLVFIRLRDPLAVIFPFPAPFTPNPAALAEPHRSDVGCLFITSIAFLLDVPESSSKKYTVLKDPLCIILGLSLNPSFNTSDDAGQSHELLNPSKNLCPVLPAWGRCDWMPKVA